MEDDRQFSDLSMSRAECPKCGATWINGEHRWSGTGVKGSDLDLAGLVCNKLGDFQCINPAKGKDGERYLGEENGRPRQVRREV